MFNNMCQKLISVTGRFTTLLKNNQLSNPMELRLPYVKKILLILFIFLTGLPPALHPSEFIPPDNPLIQYEGRIDSFGPHPVCFDWSGVAILIRFEGQSVGFLIKDGKNDYDVSVDGKAVTTW